MTDREREREKEKRTVATLKANHFKNQPHVHKISHTNKAQNNDTLNPTFTIMSKVSQRPLILPYEAVNWFLYTETFYCVILFDCGGFRLS